MTQVSEFLSTGRLWEFLLACESSGLITFNYPSEQLKTKIEQCLNRKVFCDQSPIYNTNNDSLDAESQYQTPPTSHTLPTTPSVSKYRIIGEMPLTEDRRKTTFNFNISVSDNESVSEGSGDESLSNKDEIRSNNKGNNSTDLVIDMRQSHEQESRTKEKRKGVIEETLASNKPLLDQTQPEASLDDEDEKLETLFAQIKLHSEKKVTHSKKIISRESLDAFIVSDSEEISDEELTFPKLLSPVKCYPLPTGSPGVCSTPVTQIRMHLKPTRFTTPSANKNIKRNKKQMSQELFELFNKTVFDNKLPKDMEIMWNNRLRTTAGYCAYLGSINCRKARIELSTKVCDSYDRIRDTLIHELCHAATWIIDGVRRAGHGPIWKAWGQKASLIYPDLPPISTCHSYEISYKYTYQCSKCDFKIGRHSKSLNLQTARCPYCTSTLELLL